MQWRTLGGGGGETAMVIPNKRTMEVLGFSR